MIKSIRIRLLIWYAAVLVVVVGGFTLMLYYKVQAALLEGAGDQFAGFIEIGGDRQEDDLPRMLAGDFQEVAVGALAPRALGRPEVQHRDPAPAGAECVGPAELIWQAEIGDGEVDLHAGIITGRHDKISTL